MNEHRGCVIWFTGLSGAGKTTISNILQGRIRALGRNVESLDGDVVRTHLNEEADNQSRQRLLVVIRR